MTRRRGDGPFLVAYLKRRWWLDFPMLVVQFMYHLDYWSKGLYPILTPFPHFCAILLLAYWALKEGVRVKKKIKPRPGGRYVLLWLVSLLVMGINTQLHPDEYGLPYIIEWMTLYVLLGYLGVFRARAYLERVTNAILRRLPSVEGLLRNSEEE